MSEAHAAESGAIYRHHQFDDLPQQRRTQTLGMWFFLCTEAMMFSGLFLAYVVYRWLYAEAFVVGSHSLNLLMGSINTLVLILSSLTIALAGDAAQKRHRSRLVWLLVSTAALGVVFLGIKGYEWWEDWHKGLVPVFNWTHFATHPEEAARLAAHGVTVNHLKLFHYLYFFMVGLHALHLLVGVGIVTVLLGFARRGTFTGGHSHPIELAGLYWHFVDVVWVFLYPLFYLPGGFHKF